MNENGHNHRNILMNIAHRAMLERGLLPDFSNEVIAELNQLQEPVISTIVNGSDSHGIPDMRNMLWASIDNDDSMDLDQLTVAEKTSDDDCKDLRCDRGCGLFHKKGVSDRSTRCHEHNFSLYCC